MSRDRRRDVHNRKPKRVILIACEGDNKTEKNYFDNFAGRDKDYVIKFVPGNETDPINLVNQTIQKAQDLCLDLSDEDKAYCVFDADINSEKNKQIKKSVKLAEENGIISVVSTPCVEIWFLLHFEYTTASITSNEVIRRLKKHYSKYEKNCDIYSSIENKMIVAIENARKLEKYQLQNNKELRTVEANPYTEIYKIVEELINA